MPADEVWIVELRLKPADAACFQGILQGEEGLAVMRCFDPAGHRQQLWTSTAMRDELRAWLETMRGRADFEVLDQWAWREGDPRTT